MRKFIVSSFTLLSILACAYSQNVPIGERVYDLLDQASLRGLLHGSLPNYKPLTRIEIAGLLISIENNRTLDDNVPMNLYLEMRREIESYKREIIKIAGLQWWRDLPPYYGRINRYSRKLLPTHIPPTVWDKSGRTLNLEFDDGKWLTFDPTYVFQYDAVKNQNDVFRRRWGFVLESAPAPWMNVFLRWRDVLEWGREPYEFNTRDNIFDDRIGYVNPNSVTEITYEDLLGGMTIHHSPASLFLGRDRIRWGPGRFGNLMLSGESAPFNQVKLDIELSKSIHFSSLSGSLVAWPELRETLYPVENGLLRTVRRSKYLAAHRIELTPKPWMNLGIQEAVVYGERSFDLSYLNPVSVYFTEEHENGDMDNALMGSDLRLGPWILIPGQISGMLWGEVLLDDFQFGKLGKNYYGNKSAWLSGCSFALPGGFLPVEAGYEYVKLRPYVYSHIFPINVYKHWNAPLGMQMQPNSDRSTVWVNWWLLHHIRFGFEGYFLRHGANDETYGNVGGNINESHVRNPENETAGFLDGLRDDQSRVLMWFDWEAFEGLVLSFSVGYDNATNDSYDGRYFSAGILLNKPEDRRWSLRGK
ncbi:MAG: capsule assembly Wzi family protein [Candidatus Electryonea clarkiae]|nr:capsule assembly Wzi family protein [Candidatus Electryonea clarkiae]MDP8287721.1 capsule assembly Wzi family protein [Candidatus Electryonea clarkiae]